jgi:AcrR family transcriptional regulator
LPKQPLLPRKKPRQARAAVTVETILEAAARVLSKRSLDGFNTNRIAEVAGVSVGSIYQYFPNKAALVAALIGRAQDSLADAVERSLQRSQGQRLERVLLGLIDVAIEHQFGDAVLAAALDHEEQRLPLGQMLSATQQRIAKAVQEALQAHPELAKTTVTATTTIDCFTIAKALIESEATRPKPDLAALRKRVLLALQGYLLQPATKTIPRKRTRTDTQSVQESP